MTKESVQKFNRLMNFVWASNMMSTELFKKYALEQGYQQDDIPNIEYHLLKSRKFSKREGKLIKKSRLYA